MISPKAFFDTLCDNGVEFFTGVPDSLLKEFCAFVDAQLPPHHHVIATNEGAAVGLASGHHLATGRVPLVYLQNSGLGNVINPLLSLADAEVCGLPMVVMIGWRGEPGVHDEPQHIKQGRVTEPLLSAMEYPWRVLATDEPTGREDAAWAVKMARQTNAPVVLLVRKGTFSKTEHRRAMPPPTSERLWREDMIALVSHALPDRAMVVATTGMISRELYAQRCIQGRSHGTDFLTVGAMGHASQVALGIALAQPERQVVCLDGDGALLMHMGSLAVIGSSHTGDLLHVVLNNGAHDSVGGQPTVAFDIDLPSIARACGYDVVLGPLESAQDVKQALAYMLAHKGRRFLELRVRTGSRADLGRPKEPPSQNKGAFAARLRADKP